MRVEEKERLELEGDIEVDSVLVDDMDKPMDKVELGRVMGHQIDIVEATSSGVTVEGLDVMEVLQKRLVAEKIDIRHSHIYVFRDRRLPMVTDVKPLPIDYLKSLPLSIRVGTVKQESGFFTYEKFPKKGNKTGVKSSFTLGFLLPG